MRRLIHCVLLVTILFFASHSLSSAASRVCGDPIFAGDTCSCDGNTTPTPVAGGFCCGYVYGGTCHATPQQSVSCGTQFDSADSSKRCSASCGNEQDYQDANGFFWHCCGWAINGHCSVNPPTATIGCGNVIGTTSTVSCSCSNGIQSFGQSLCCGWVDTIRQQCIANPPPATVPAICGQAYPTAQASSYVCSCTSGTQSVPGNNTCCGWADLTQPDSCAPTAPIVKTNVTCGRGYDPNTQTCDCGNYGAYTPPDGTGKLCCGWPTNTLSGCSATAPVATSPPTAPPNNPGGGGGPVLNPGGGIGAGELDNLNSAIFGGAPDASLTTPRGIIGRLLPYLFTFGGLILFIMLIWGGFEMLTGAANPKSQEAGKQRMTAAVIGFILLFGSYWLAQLVQAIFGISIL